MSALNPMLRYRQMRAIFLHYTQLRYGRSQVSGLAQYARMVGSGFGFVGFLARHRGDFWEHATRPSSRSRARVLRILMSPEGLPKFDETWLVPSPDAPRPQRQTNIVVPVFNGIEFLKRSLPRLLDNTEAPFHLIIVDDASTDMDTAHYLDALAETAPETVSLVRLPENLGFVGAANAGLSKARDRGGHAVLVNSDAMVPPNWLGRLLAPLADPNVASVTPMTNDGQIVSLGTFSQAIPLKDDQIDLLDSVAASLSSKRALDHPMPTGVGFCMAMSETWLDQHPGFDPIFGRGYGEEVDWCRRTADEGAIHLAATDLFVGHVGHSTFGAEEKKKLNEAHHGILIKRYPKFEKLVRQFQLDDPLATVRMRLVLAWAASLSPDPLRVFVLHTLGGGTEQAVFDQVEQLNAAGKPAVILRVHSDAHFAMEVVFDDVSVHLDVEPFDAVQRLLDVAPKRHVTYSCAVGAENAHNLPHVLLDLVSPPDASLDVEFHDYFPISPSYCLVGASGVFEGVPGLDTEDAVHDYVTSDGQRIAHRDWRAAWRSVLERAREVRAFSESSAAIVREAFPELATPIVVKPHIMRAHLPDLQPSRQTPRTIGVLGSLNPAKGAELVDAMAKSETAKREDLRFVVIGKLPPTIRPSRRLKIHGAYQIDEVGTLALTYGIDAWMMPSVWPETFSYTVRE
ncbi:MAG: glycosyltransferase, partial [Rhodobacteraceae bacterium]|nr:glycosyltransferase [Paracoccaceae bacterium]